jgi:hypothetical protein
VKSIMRQLYRPEDGSDKWLEREEAVEQQTIYLASAFSASTKKKTPLSATPYILGDASQSIV